MLEVFFRPVILEASFSWSHKYSGCVRMRCRAPSPHTFTHPACTGLSHTETNIPASQISSNIDNNRSSSASSSSSSSSSSGSSSSSSSNTQLSFKRAALIASIMSQSVLPQYKDRRSTCMKHAASCNMLCIIIIIIIIIIITILLLLIMVTIIIHQLIII